MKSGLSLLILIAGFGLYILASASLYTVSETEQVIITQFGKPVGETISEAGLHLKTPFIQTVNRFDKRPGMGWSAGKYADERQSVHCGR
jgi:membrane protease subunit HflC